MIGNRLSVLKQTSNPARFPANAAYSVSKTISNVFYEDLCCCWTLNPASFTAATFRLTQLMIGFPFLLVAVLYTSESYLVSKVPPVSDSQSPQSTLTWGVNNAASVHHCNLVCSEGVWAAQHAATGITAHSRDAVIPASIPYPRRLCGPPKHMQKKSRGWREIHKVASLIKTAPFRLLLLRSELKTLLT